MKAKVERDWYGREKSTEELQDDVRNWRSEIDFVHDEIRFFDHLLGSNYIDFLEYNLEEKTKKLTEEISKEKKVGVELQTLINKHEETLGNLLENNSVAGNTHFVDMHKTLEFEMMIFFKKFKKLKRQIFEVVESVMQKKDQKKLIKHS